MLSQWISQHSIQFTLLISYIPLIATVVTCILSIVLARATLRYSETTERSLALAREEFEREWSPELHIKLERISETDARIVVTNLARISVLLQLVQMRRTALAVPFGKYLLNEPLVGGRTWTEDVTEKLMIGAGNEFQGQVATSITFYASGRMYRTDWFRFDIEIRHGKLLRLDPVNIAARRVRVLEPRRGENLRRELVMDVVSSAPEQGGDKT